MKSAQKAKRGTPLEQFRKLFRVRNSSGTLFHILANPMAPLALSRVEQFRNIVKKHPSGTLSPPVGGRVPCSGVPKGEEET